MALQEFHNFTKVIRQVSPAIKDENRQMLDSFSKGITLVENNPNLLPKQDNLFNNSIGVFLQEFIEDLALFIAQVFLVGKKQVTVLP